MLSVCCVFRHYILLLLHDDLRCADGDTRLLFKIDYGGKFFGYNSPVDQILVMSQEIVG